MAFFLANISANFCPFRSNSLNYDLLFALLGYLFLSTDSVLKRHTFDSCGYSV